MHGKLSLQRDTGGGGGGRVEMQQQTNIEQFNAI
jgi:hypothetical protein